MTARIVLLVTSPRLPAGLLTAAAWDILRAHPVFAAADSEQAEALRRSGIPVTIIESDPERLLTELAATGSPATSATSVPAASPVDGLTGPATDGLTGSPSDDGHGKAVVWLAGPTGDEAFARTLGLRLAREPALAELELMYGSWDPPGARLLDAVSVMDRLVSPGGDPWKRAQNHRTLAPYLLEESYEAYDAIEAGDTDALREELGDVLLQIVLHSRLAEELPEDEAWTIDDVAGGLVDKMVRRNPHVFAGVPVADLEEITENWDRIKKAEKARDSTLDGVALSQPALALAAKILQRTRRAGLDVPVPDGSDLGERLLRMVAENGADAEQELRRAALNYAEAVRSAERNRAAQQKNVGPAE